MEEDNFFPPTLPSRPDLAGSAALGGGSGKFRVRTTAALSRRRDWVRLYCVEDAAVAAGRGTGGRGTFDLSAISPTQTTSTHPSTQDRIFQMDEQGTAADIEAKMSLLQKVPQMHMGEAGWQQGASLGGVGLLQRRTMETMESSKGYEDCVWRGAILILNNCS